MLLIFSNILFFCYVFRSFSRARLILASIRLFLSLFSILSNGTIASADKFLIVLFIRFMKNSSKNFGQFSLLRDVSKNEICRILRFYFVFLNYKWNLLKAVL
jgi:hypothetical protein